MATEKQLESIKNARAARRVGPNGGRLAGTKNRATLVREEVEKEFHQRILERVNGTLLKAYDIAIKKGDWRAADALLDRLFGRATERHEIVAAISLADMAKEADMIEQRARQAKVVEHVEVPESRTP